MRKAPIIELSVRQHEALVRLVRQPTTEQRVAARAPFGSHGRAFFKSRSILSPI